MFSSREKHFHVFDYLEKSVMVPRCTVSILIIALLALLFFQFQSIFYSPAVDCMKYFGGDELWLLSNFREQILTGRYYNPYALGSTLHAGGGIVFGNAWLTALLYGLPCVLVNAPLYVVGRSVTLVLSILLVTASILIIQKYTSDWVLSLGGGILLVANMCFYFTSHSGRYDILIGLLNLVLMFGLTKDLTRGVRSARFILLIPFAGILVSPHLLLQLLIPSLVVLFKRPEKRLLQQYASCWALAITGAIFLYYATWGRIDLFGPPPAKPSIFVSFLGSIPIVHPFEFQRQWTNLLGRLEVLFRWAPMIMIALLMGLIILVLRWNKIRSVQRKSYLLLIGYLIISNILLENRDDKYLIYVLPSMVVGLIIIAAEVGKGPLPKIALLAFVALAILIQVPQIIRASHLGKQITARNQFCIQQSLRIADSIGPRHTGRMLAYPPAASEVAFATPNVVTTGFLKLPSSQLSCAGFMDSLNVDYVLAYSYSAFPDSILEEAPIGNALQERGTLLRTWSGHLTDMSCSYAKGVFWGADTLKLFRWQRR